MKEDLDKPMGNAELRVTLASIESEISDVKGIAISTNSQAKLTNGHVADAFREIENLKRWRTGLTYAWAVFVLILLPILGETLYKTWNTEELTAQQVQYSVKNGVTDALAQYQLQNNK